MHHRATANQYCPSLWGDRQAAIRPIIGKIVEAQDAVSEHSRRVCRSHTPRDLDAAVTLDDGYVVLARQIKPELGTISEISA